MNSYFLEATSLHFYLPLRPLRLFYRRFALVTAIFAASLLFSIPSANAQEEPVEGGTLPGVTITEAEARNIMKGLFDFTRFSHTMAIGKIARDERLTTFTDGFVQRNNIEVLTIGYIDSDHFWPRVFREQRLRKIEKAPTDNLLAAKIIFMPDETDDGNISGYNITLELTGKSQQVYDLLQVSREEIDSIASQTSQQQLGTPFATPSEAKETVVNALIAALQQVESKATPQEQAVAVVAFQRDVAQEYGFDSFAHSALQADYPATPIAGQTVMASWKSLESNVPDQVLAIDPAAQLLTFAHDGAPVAATAGENDNSYKLTLTGASDGTQGELLALAGDQTVGVLQTISYSKKYTSVKIVPVNGGMGNHNLANLQQRLDAIYAPAVAGWQVEVLPDQNLGTTWDTNQDGKLSDSETGMLSNYTEEMNNLIEEFRKRHNRSRDIYYVFLVDKPATAGKLGYMPRKKQWGFVFTGNHGNTDALVKTIAHELGHGVYRLEHPFAERGLPRGETDNLMDYSNGTALYKYQWDFVHDPASVFTLFEEDEDGALEGVYESAQCIKLLASSNYTIGANPIKLRYEIKGLQTILTGSGLSTEVSDYELLMFVEKNKKIVYSYKVPLNNKGEVVWHGLVFQEDEEMTSTNSQNYLLHLGITAKAPEDELYKHWAVSMGSRPMSSVISEEGTQEAFRTFVDLIPSIPFTVEAAWDDWRKVSDEVKKITNYADYKAIEGIIRNEGKGIGEIFAEVENPLQFLYDNSTETTFLDVKVRVHWTMVNKLKAVESRLTDQSIRFGRYRAGEIGGIGIRPMYGKSKNYVSNHSYGMVLDIKANHNHYIGSDQSELIYFIQHVTGLNLFDKNARTAEKIVEASEKFKTETEGLSFDKLLTIYAEVDDYHNKPENKYRLEELNTTNPLSEIEPIAADVSIGIIDKGRISEFYVKLEKLNVLLNQREQRYYLEYLVFDEVARAELEDLRQGISALTAALMPLESDFTEANIIDVIGRLIIPEIGSISNFVANYNGYRAALEEKFITNRDDELIIFKRFTQQLNRSASTEDFIRHIFTNGFCEVPLELIQAFTDEPDMQWGGIWNGDNVDYMHFEVKATAIEKYLSQEKQK